MLTLTEDPGLIRLSRLYVSHFTKIAHFSTPALDLDAASTEACLTGALYDDTPISGCDAVRIVRARN